MSFWPRTLFSQMSLRARLVGLFSWLLALLSLALATWLPARVDRQTHAIFETRALDMSRLVAASSEASLDFDDEAAAEDRLSRLASTDAAAYAVLVREGGEELAAWPGPGRTLPLGAEGGEATLYQDDLLHVRVPLVTRSGHHGALLTGFRLGDLQARHRETRAYVVAGCALVLAAGLLATLLLGTLLARPLLAIAAVARRIAGGDVAAAGDLPLARGDEAGDVARALARMLNRLYEDQATIEALNAGLERRVADRTGALERANAELAERLVELKRTQEQLIVADRRISVGRLAAGVAHEINNPLAFIQANLRFAGEQLPGLVERARSQGGIDLPVLERLVGELGEAIAESQQGADRVHHIVRGLKTFARTDEDRRERVDVREALEAAIDMSAHELRHRAQLVRELGAAPPIEGNGVRLSQVFLNLLLNAVQAIPEGAAGGRIRVALSTDARGWALAEVEDTGTGIAPEHLSRIFDPFFTTKPVGVGTGLGLSISQGIVLSLGGEIGVTSQPGVGTTFRVALPPATAQAPGRLPGGGGAPAGPGQAAALLVVDDEPLVGAAVRRALGRRHEVAVATSGAEALQLVRAGARFDHILCDVMMPGMTGMEFHAELKRLAPELADAVTFMTGGAFTEGARDFLERHPGAWVEKPLDLERVRRLVDGPV